MKKNFSKKGSPTALRGNPKPDSKEEGKFKKNFGLNKNSYPAHHKGAFQSNNYNETKINKKNGMKKECYPTGFREVYPSANYDEVQQKVKKNIKVAEKEKVTVLCKSKGKNLNVDLKDSDTSNICSKAHKLSFFKTDNEIPSCATVRQDLITHNQDPLKSPLSDLYFLGENYNSLYDSTENVRIPQVLDNNINAMKINLKGTDSDIEQLVYFLHEYMGHKYPIESSSKPLTEIEKCSLNTNFQNFLFSFLLNLPIQQINEISLNEIKSAVVQQAVMDTYSSSKTDMDPGNVSKDTIPVDKENYSDEEYDDLVTDNEESQEKISVASTESYEVQEIKTNDSSENAETTHHQEDNGEEKAKEDSSSLDNESTSDKNSDNSSIGSDDSQDQSGGNKSDPHITGDSNDGNEIESSSPEDNLEDEHSETSKTSESKKSEEVNKSRSQSQDSTKDDKEAEESQGEEKERENSAEEEDEEAMDTEDKDKQSADTKGENGQSDGDKGKKDNGETDESDQTWLQTLQEKIYNLLLKLNIIRGPTLHDSVMHSYNYIRAVKDSMGEDSTGQRE